MIVVHKGETLTSTATEDEVLFVELNENGEIVPVGRETIMFETLTGTVQVAVGKSVNTAKATSHTSSAAAKFILTIRNAGYAQGEPQEGNNTNLRIVGVGTVDCNW